MGQTVLVSSQRGPSGKRSRSAGTRSMCVCPKCGTAFPFRRGSRCEEQVCPTCGTRLVPKRN
jgi:hypothetical protein